MLLRPWANKALERATPERGLEGIVLKRVDAAYQPGRRSGAWLKRKHRRSERFAVTGWIPARPGRLDTFLIGRPSHGEIVAAGGVQLVLNLAERAQLRVALAEREVQRRGSVRWVGPRVEVDVTHSGQPGGVVRDALLRSIVRPPAEEEGNAAAPQSVRAYDGLRIGAPQGSMLQNGDRVGPLLVTS